MHQTLMAVTKDFERFEFNTIISAQMELINEMIVYKNKGGWDSDEWHEAVDIYIRMMAPITPHISEEIWSKLGKKYSIHQQDWPQVDEDATKEEMFTLVIQVNGKLRDRAQLPVGMSEEDVRKIALASEKAQKFIDGKETRKVIYVPGRLVNIIV